MNVRLVVFVSLLSVFTGVSARFVPEFNRIGYVRSSTHLGGGIQNIHSAAIDQQGRIVVVGDHNNDYGVILRYNSDGSLDTTFNSTGYKIQNGETVSRRFFDCKIDSSGKIVVSGQRLDGGVTGYGLILRYNSNGTLDTTFNATGYNSTAVVIYYQSCAFGNDGKILVTGQASAIGGGGVIARYNTNGTLDTTFNNPNGYLNARIAMDAGYFNDLQVDSNNKIIVVGSTAVAGPNGIIVRYNPTGLIDNDFGVDGKVEFSIDPVALYIQGCSFDQDGKIIVVGYQDTNPQEGFVARFNADGSLDDSFNDTGYRIESDESPVDFRIMRSCLIDSNNKVVVVGVTAASKGFIGRYNGNGSLDTTFNKVGYFEDTYAGSWVFYKIKEDHYNRLIITGITGDLSGIILRYLSNGLLDAHWNVKNCFKYYKSLGKAIPLLND